MLGRSESNSDQPYARAVAVLDIGSNSVRLVVYERLSRALTPMFNEKSTCALGRGVAQTGKIAEENVARGLSAIKRFAMAVDLMGVKNVHIIATSAVREATNGPAFMAEVERMFDCKGHVLSGDEEAHFAALGVISGMPDFCGVVGDMGGGSLEFSDLSGGYDQYCEYPNGETLTLGAIRLQDDSDGSPKKALDIARERVANSSVIEPGASSDFCAIGGTWRALAKLMQVREDYPLHMIQNYQVKALDMIELCALLIKKGEDVSGTQIIGSARRGLLAYGAAAMMAVLEHGQFENVLFSVLGVREGYLFARLDHLQVNKHPLLEASRLFCSLRARSPDHAEDLFAFTNQFYAASRHNESDRQKRLRQSACYLSDIGWRGHPDYRGAQSVDLVAYSALTGVDHPGRAFLAETLAVRYMGLKQDVTEDSLVELAGKNGSSEARLLGALLRVAYQLSSAVPHTLPRVRFEVAGGDMDGSELELLIPADLIPLDSGRLRNRLKNLAAQANLESIEIRQI